MTMKVEREMSETLLKKYLSMVHELAGITMSPKKRELLQGRVRPRMKALEISTFSDYFTYLESNKSEIQNFINQVTTNETLFFRTDRIWKYFSKEFLPQWYAAHPN